MRSVALLLSFFSVFVGGAAPTLSIGFVGNIDPDDVDYGTSGFESAFGFYLAMIDVQQSGMLGGYHLSTFYNSSSKPQLTLFSSIYQLNYPVTGVVGAGDSSDSKLAQMIVSRDAIPQISFASSSPVFANNPDIYPTFSRVISNDNFQGMFVARLVWNHNWTRACTIFGTDDYGVGLSGVFYDTFTALGGVVAAQEGFLPSDGVDVSSQIARIKATGVRIIAIFGITYYLVPVFEELHRQGMLGAGYVLLGTDGWMGDIATYGEPTRSYARGALGTMPSADTTLPEFVTFANKWKNVPVPSWMAGKIDPDSATVWGALGYDAALLMAYGCSRVIANGGNPHTNRSGLLWEIRHAKIMGVSGFIEMDPATGDRLGSFDLLNLQAGGMVKVGTYSLAGMHLTDTVHWPGDRTDTPQGYRPTCPAGQYPANLANGDTPCTTCPSGLVALTAGSLSCTTCPESMIPQGPARCVTSPSACRAGTFFNNDTAKCQNCGAGAFSETSGATECRKCPPESTNVQPLTINAYGGFDKFVANTSKACECLPGYYGGQGGSCVTCPTGSFCCACEGMEACINAATTGDDDACKTSAVLAAVAQFGKPCESCVQGVRMPIAQPGYFRSLESPVIFLKCQPTDACLGGAKSQCAVGYTDERCGTCATNYYVSNGKCIECPNRAASTGLMVVVAIICLVFLGYALRAGSSWFKCGALSILFDFVQTTSLALPIRIEWPDELRIMLNGFTSFNFNINLLANSCFITQSFFGQWLLELVAPLFFLAAFFALVGLMTLAGRFGWLQRHQVHKWRAMACNATMFACTLAHTYMTQKAFSMLNCRTLENGVAYLSAHPSVRCYAPETMKYRAVAIVAVFIYGLGVPALFFFILLWGRRSHLIYTTWFKRRFGAIYIIYKRDLWFWETWMKLRKFLIICLVNMLADAVIWQSMLPLAVLMVSAAFASLVRPFRFVRNDGLQFMAASVSTLVMLAGIIVSFGQPELISRTLLIVVVLILSGVTLLALLHGCIYEYIAYFGRGMASRSRFLLCCLRRPVMERLFHSKTVVEAMHEAGHWARNDMALGRKHLKSTKEKNMDEPNLEEITMHSLEKTDPGSLDMFYFGPYTTFEAAQRMEMFKLWKGVPNNAQLLATLSEARISMLEQQAFRAALREVEEETVADVLDNAVVGIVTTVLHRRVAPANSHLSLRAQSMASLNSGGPSRVTHVKGGMMLADSYMLPPVLPTASPPAVPPGPPAPRHYRVADSGIIEPVTGSVVENYEDVESDTSSDDELYPNRAPTAFRPPPSVTRAQGQGASGLADASHNAPGEGPSPRRPVVAEKLSPRPPPAVIAGSGESARSGDGNNPQTPHAPFFGPGGTSQVRLQAGSRSAGLLTEQASSTSLHGSRSVGTLDTSAARFATATALVTDGSEQHTVREQPSIEDAHPFGLSS